MEQLPSWHDGATKAAITDFVARVTEEGGPDYVDPAARVAVFDNDGTLWTEKPLVIQLDFTIRRFRELAEDDPALRTQQPYQAAYQGDMRWLSGAVVKRDVPMLAFSGTPSAPALRLLLLHDDADREFDYTAGAEQALETAKSQNWTVVSMKNDWAEIFAATSS
jgi:hypothetical protein